MKKRRDEKTENTEKLRDLKPRALDEKEAGNREAEAVKGGATTFSDVLVSS